MIEGKRERAYLVASSPTIPVIAWCALGPAQPGQTVDHARRVSDWPRAALNMKYAARLPANGVRTSRDVYRFTADDILHFCKNWGK
ncbi:MAG: hypothetical protein R2854_11565 [Caldilineaceae bacterium]